MDGVNDASNSQGYGAPLRPLIPPEEDDVEYGIRRSRRNTSYHYRDSSSLAPAQIMEQEVHYHYATISLDIAYKIMRIICLLATAQHLLTAILRRSESLRNQINHTAAERWDRLLSDIQLIMCRIKVHADLLLFYVEWVKAVGEVSLLYAEDLSVFVRRRNRFHPKSKRRLSDLSRDDCDSWFGLSPNELYRLWISHSSSLG